MIVTDRNEITGYMHSAYAESLREFGVPHLLPGSGGYILERNIPSTRYRDAMGCYPLFTCSDWSALIADFEQIGDELVSLSVITDPLGDFDLDYLRRCFKDVVSPFKQHFVVDLRQPMSEFIHPHHRRNAQRGLQSVEIERHEEGSKFIDEWTILYADLVRRRSIRGIATFSRSCFAKQLTVPGIHIFRAMHEGQAVGMAIWYITGDVGYYHLGAYSEVGYNLRAAFAIFWRAIEYFSARGVRWLNLGGRVGLKTDETDGLSRFKRGWSTETKTAYLCGRIFDRLHYSVLTPGLSNNSYFPAYRKGENG